LKLPPLNQIQTGYSLVIVFSLLIAILVGASFFLIPSYYAPILIAALVALIPLVLYWIKKPVYALYTVVFISLLPHGLIPQDIYDYLYKLLAIVATATWLIDILRRRGKIIFTPTSLFIFLFMLWSLITLFWTSNVSIGITFLQIYLARFVIFLLLVPNLIRTDDRLDGFMTVLALSAWTLVISSVVTVLSTGFLPGMRFKVFEENENALGIITLVSMTGVVWKALRPSKLKIKIWRPLAFIFLLAAIGIIAMSGSRGSLISLFVTFVAFLFWKQTRVFGKVGILYLIIIGLLTPILFKATFERFTLADPTNTLLGGREALWSAAWMYIKNNPWIGAGIGNSNYVMLSYLQYFRSILGLNYAPVHNPILTIWMETGLPGLILFLSGLISATVVFIKLYIKNKSLDYDFLRPYFPIIISVFCGYMLSWIKGGGIESSVSYFLILALLLIPACFVPSSLPNPPSIR